MTAAQFELIDETEAEAILRWRFEELVRSGYDIGSALVLASHVEVDLHDASSLTRSAESISPLLPCRSKLSITAYVLASSSPGNPRSDSSRCHVRGTSKGFAGVMRRTSPARWSSGTCSIRSWISGSRAGAFLRRVIARTGPRLRSRPGG